MATVAWPISVVAMFDAGLMGKDAESRTFAVNIASRWMEGLERRLEGRDWIAADNFTIADIVLAGVLREARETQLMDAYPNVRALYERAAARPAWRRTLELTAERMGVSVERIE